MSKLKEKKKFKGINNNVILIIIFAVVFVLTLFGLSALFRHILPPVDVQIGGEEIAAEDASEEFPEGDVDDRLKWIQFEDNLNQSPSSDSPSIADNSVTQYDTDLEVASKRVVANEEIPLPVKTKRDYAKQSDKVNKYNDVNVVVPPVPSISEVAHVAKSTLPPKMTKVYVGFYDSLEQALVVQNKLSNFAPGIQPFVKNVNGQYIVQIASFSDRAKAVDLKTQLSAQGYSARLLSQ